MTTYFSSTWNALCVRVQKKVLSHRTQIYFYLLFFLSPSFLFTFLFFPLFIPLSPFFSLIYFFCSIFYMGTTTSFFIFLSSLIFSFFSSFWLNSHHKHCTKSLLKASILIGTRTPFTIKYRVKSSASQIYNSPWIRARSVKTHDSWEVSKSVRKIDVEITMNFYSSQRNGKE